MLLERNQFLIGVIAVVVVAIGTVFAVGATAGRFVPGFRMTAEFTDAAGLGKGDFVFVAGVRVGQVTDVAIDGDHVRAEFSVTSDGVPDNSEVAIILQSTLGKRALRILPGTSGTYFAAGSNVPIGRTYTPVDLPELGDRSAELLGEVNVEALQSLISALADITEGNREDVAQLLDGVERVSNIVVSRRTELEQVIDRAQTLIDAAADSDREIVRIVDAFGEVLDTLLAKRTEITRLLVETGDTSTLTADLVAERRAQLDGILDELTEDLALVDAHQVDLAHFFAYVGVGFEGFASIGYAGLDQTDNGGWGNVFVTGLGAAGVDALLGCGQPLDEVLSTILLPDPTCTTTAAASAPVITAPKPTYGDASGFFQPAIVASLTARPAGAETGAEVAS